MALTHAFIALLLAAPALAQQPVYAQCGGKGWSGSTTCVSGTHCQYSNDYYSQCLPGGGTTPAPTTTPPAPTTTPPAPTTSPTTTPTSPTTTAPAPTGPAGSCPTLPSTITLKSDAKLPDPFTFFGGQKVVTKADWTCRRAEISQLLQTYELGTLPPKPSGFTATYSGGTLSMTATEAGKSISFTATISAASGGTAPYPAIIGIGGISIPKPASIALITFNNDDMALQNDQSSRGVGKFYNLYGSGHSAGAMMAWAWGVGRVIDALEMTTGHNIDVKRLGVSGCSRNGKGALVAGAFNDRIALTIPQESGSGGGGCWRISDKMLASGTSTQTASEIVGENVWFSKNFNPYVNSIPTLPFDHHMLAGLVAPRPLLVIDNTGIDWLGPESVWGCMKTATKIYQALGVPDYMGVSQVGNHDHCAFPSNEQNDLTPFLNRFLLLQSANTAIVKTDGANNLGFSDADWIDWTVPTLT